QKRALQIVQKYKYPVAIFDHVKNSDKYDFIFDWQEVFKQFHEYESSSTEEIDFKPVDEAAVKEILSSHDFSDSRIDSGLLKLRNLEEGKKQKGLGDFF
ncbi:hypothetical protein HN499_00505, partial [archaeon]|nr:hypothetical protein [archaeon]